MDGFKPFTLPSLLSTQARLQTRRMGYSALRIVELHRRYGMDARKIRDVLDDFMRTMEAHGARPTFPVPGQIVEKHPNLFIRLAEQGAELAMHGYAHWDFSRLERASAIRQVEKVRRVFLRYGWGHAGFRFPYLRMRDDSLELLAGENIPWDSSSCIHWDVLDRDAFGEERWDAYERILASYAPSLSAGHNVLPRWVGHMVEIPVSLPDDDMLIDRLGIRSPDSMFRAWNAMFRGIAGRGGVYVIQLHPERFHCYRAALDRLLDVAAQTRSVWIATLGAIAGWWREKDSVQAVCLPVGNRAIEIVFQGSARIAVETDPTGSSTGRFPSPRTGANHTRWHIPSGRGRVAAIPNRTPARFERLLRTRGFLVERTDAPKGYHFAFPEPPGDPTSHEDWLEHMLMRSEHALLKIRTWPNPYNSALVVTGDVDSVDIWDFWNRLHG